MQFGKIHGIALVVLGLLLIALQIDFAFSGRAEVLAPSTSSSAEVPQVQAHRLGPLAGILGGAALIGGLVIYVTARRRDEPPPDRAVK